MTIATRWGSASSGAPHSLRARGRDDGLERELRDLAEHSPLPAKPDHEGVERFLLNAYRTTWEEMFDKVAE